MASPIEFTNVPQNEELLLCTSECLCQICGKGNLTPFKVNSCQDILCAECWQKSACNLGGKENKCLKCGVRTELLCFKDYNQFIGFNLIHGDLLMANEEIKAGISRCEEIEKETRSKALNALAQHEKHILSCFFEQAKMNRNRRNSRRSIGMTDTVKNPELPKKFKFLTNDSMRKIWS